MSKERVQSEPFVGPVRKPPTNSEIGQALIGVVLASAKAGHATVRGTVRDYLPEGCTSDDALVFVLDVLRSASGYGDSAAAILDRWTGDHDAALGGLTR